MRTKRSCTRDVCAFTSFSIIGCDAPVRAAWCVAVRSCWIHIRRHRCKRPGLESEHRWHLPPHLSCASPRRHRHLRAVLAKQVPVCGVSWQVHSNVGLEPSRSLPFPGAASEAPARSVDATGRSPVLLPGHEPPSDLGGVEPCPRCPVRCLTNVLSNLLSPVRTDLSAVPRSQHPNGTASSHVQMSRRRREFVCEVALSRAR